MKIRAKILVIEPAGNLWGSERVLLDFLSVSSAVDLELIVCYPSASPIELELQKRKVKTLPVFTNEIGKRSYIKKALTTLKLTMAIIKIKPNLIYVNQAGATRRVMLAALLLRVPLVAHIRLLEDVHYIAACNYWFLRRLYVVAISKFIYAASKEHISLPANRMEMIYDLYVPGAPHEEATQHEACGSRFVCIGRLAKIKGQDVVINAVKYLHDRSCSVSVDFIGSAQTGSNFDRVLEKRAAELGVDRQLRWAGFKKDVFYEARGACGLICPSRIEPLGRVILEAWDIGLVPIVWKGSGGAAEIVRDSDAGVFYSEQTGESLGLALKRVAEMKPSEKQLMIDKGRRWMKLNCSQENYLAELTKLWCHAIKARAA